MVKRLCLSSTVEVAVSPDALSLCPALSPPYSSSLFLYLNPTFCISLMLPLLLSLFTSYYLTTRCPHNTSLSHPSIYPCFLSLGSLFDHFLLLTIFVSLKGKTLLPSSQQVMPPPSNPQIVSLLPVWWCNVDIIPKDSIDLGWSHEKAVYGQCLWFPEVRACGETRALAFLDIVVSLLGTTER